MSNLKFFKGLEQNLPQNKTLLENESFYLTEQNYNFYYSDRDKNLKLLFAEPSIRLKEIHTYYSTSSNLKPTSFPPPDSDWSLIEPVDFQGGDFGNIVTCKVYMDGSFKYSQVTELITTDDIDYICGDSINTTTSKLGQAVVGQMILNKEE